MRTHLEVAIFVTRDGGSEVLVVHRSPQQGGYWHVIAGGVEEGETLLAAAERELREETGLVAPLATGADVIEYSYPLTDELAERRALYHQSVTAVDVTCFHADAPDGWEPALDWEHDDYRWCGLDDACARLRWPDTAAALRAMIASPRTTSPAHNHG